MATQTNTTSSQISCAACSKASGTLRVCTACKSVHYCSVKCQKSHRKSHRAMCNRHKRELAVEAVLAALPPKPECPICCLPFPPIDNAFGLSLPLACCGKVICWGCQVGVLKQDCTGADGRPKKNPLTSVQITCPFCRDNPGKHIDYDRITSQYRKLAARGDAEGMYQLAKLYAGGLGVEKDEQQEFELLTRAADLGCIDAIYSLSEHYGAGSLGLNVDEKKQRELLEKAAAMGDLVSIHNLGCYDMHRKNFDAGVCHLRVAASCGMNDSMKYMYACYSDGHISKDELADTLRAFQAAQDEMKSDDRELANKMLGQSK